MAEHETSSPEQLPGRYGEASVSESTPPAEAPAPASPDGPAPSATDGDGVPSAPASATDAPTPPVEKKKKKKKKKKNRGKLGTDRGIETMFRTSYRVNMDLSALADTKSNIMISINGIIISILLASISPKIDTNPFLLIPTTVLLVGCLLSMVYAVLAARPRVSSQVISLEEVMKNRANILFFGNFARLNEDEFVRGMTELMQNVDGLYYNMIRDIYGLGRVLAVKYRLLRTSYTIFMVALILGVLLFIGSYMLVAGGTASVIETPLGL